LKKKKVLVLAYSDINYDPRIMKQCMLLEKNNYDVSFHGVSYGGVKCKNLFKTSLYFKRPRSVLFQYLQYIPLMLIFFMVHIRYLFKSPIVIVHNMPNFLVITSLPFRFLGSLIIMDIHDDSMLVLSKSFSNKFLLYIFNLVENSISLKVPHKLMTVNRVLAHNLKLNTGKDILTIHNAPGTVPSSCNNNYIANSRVRLVYIGHIGTHYGLKNLLHYIYRIKDTIPLSLDIYGDGLLSDELKKLAHKLKIEDLVQFHGRYLSNDINNILKSYHLGVAMYDINPLTNIILPVKLLEYTFNCIPTITTPLKVTKSYFKNDSVCYANSYKDFEKIMKDIYNGKIDLVEMQNRAKTDIEPISWEREGENFLKYIGRGR
jgi:glycosyltransferase involved in cell wall biosynthesis